MTTRNRELAIDGAFACAALAELPLDDLPPVAYVKVETGWHAYGERDGVTVLRMQMSGGGSPDDPSRDAAAAAQLAVWFRALDAAADDARISAQLRRGQFVECSATAIIRCEVSPLGAREVVLNVWDHLSVVASVRLDIVGGSSGTSPVVPIPVEMLEPLPPLPGRTTT